MIWSVLEDWIYLYYLNYLEKCKLKMEFLRIEFICIIWTHKQQLVLNLMFLRIEFICIIWTNEHYRLSLRMFLRIEFICIIWTMEMLLVSMVCSWGLNLFVLFERYSWYYWRIWVLEDWIYLYYLNVMPHTLCHYAVLEDWIYLYYLNRT